MLIRETTKLQRQEAGVCVVGDAVGVHVSDVARRAGVGIRACDVEFMSWTSLMGKDEWTTLCEPSERGDHIELD